MVYLMDDWNEVNKTIAFTWFLGYNDYCFLVGVSQFQNSDEIEKNMEEREFRRQII